MIESTPGRLPIIRFSDDADNDSFATVLGSALFEFVLQNGERITGEVIRLDWDGTTEFLLVREWETETEHFVPVVSIVEAIYI